MITKTVFAVLLFASTLAAQTNLVAARVSPNAKIYPGGTVALLMQLMVSNAAGPVPVAMQWDFAGINASAVAVSEGTLDTGVGKSTTCAVRPGNGIRCISAGLNVTPYIGSGGPLCTLTITLAPGAALGSFTITSTGLGADANANLVAVTMGNPIFASLSATPCDLNADGKIDQTDLGASLAQALGIIACSNGDLDGNGKCDIFDLVKVIQAATGAACVVPTPGG